MTHIVIGPGHIVAAMARGDMHVAIVEAGDVVTFVTLKVGPDLRIETIVGSASDTIHQAQALLLEMPELLNR